MLDDTLRVLDVTSPKVREAIAVATDAKSLYGRSPPTTECNRPSGALSPQCAAEVRLFGGFRRRL